MKNEKNLTQFITVAELKEALTKRGLPTDGLKAVLANRLQAHLDEDEAARQMGGNNDDDNGDFSPDETRRRVMDPSLIKYFKRVRTAFANLAEENVLNLEQFA